MTFDPGRLRERLSFQKRSVDRDELDNDDTGDWLEEFQRAALFLPRAGSEAVLAARLEGRQPMTIVVRRDSATGRVTGDWQLVDVRRGTVFAITAPPADLSPDQSGEWLTIQAESGVAS